MTVPVRTQFLAPLLNRLRFIMGLMIAFVAVVAQATTVVITVSGSWTAPVGVTSIAVEVWGAGGAGGGNATTSDGGGGGGGGGYSMVNGLTVTPGNVYSIHVGTGGSGAAGAVGNAGDQSWFQSAGTVQANGGAGGQPPSSGSGGVGGAGGAGSSFNGGKGGTGENNSSGDGGPGGSSAGTAANGTNGPTIWSTVNAAAAPTGGGKGGNGGAATNNGSAPTSGNSGGGGGSGDKNNSGSANRTGGAGADGKIVITYQASQTITFGSAPTVVVGGSGTVIATGGASGNPVTFNSLTTSTCTVSGTNGSTVTGVAVGTCTIAANQAGDLTDYNAAAQVTQNMTVGMGSQTITFGAAPTVVVGGTGTVSATGGASGNPVTFTSTTSGVCTVSGTNGSTVTGVAVGTCTIAAHQLGSANYNAAPQVTQNFTVSPSFCSPPSNIPAGVSVSCVCDQFARGSLNPSTIFSANWIVNTSGTTSYTPTIASSGYLRLTDTNGNEATSATVPGIFPAAGNFISVEFQQYAYNGSGADGIAVTLSDYSQTAIPGAYGGSLGYAQKTGINGFNGGWVGIALDEYGNYENSGEGRYGGLSASTLYPQSVGVRGSGAGSGNATSNYPWLGGTTALSPGIANSGSVARAYGYYYQIIVDARNAANATPQTYIGVNRDTAGLGNYSTLIAPIEVFSKNPSQAAVPDNWQISFTGSTGGATDIHEIGGLRICAQTVLPPSGGTASGFNAVDEAYGTPPGVSALNYVSGHIYTKLVGAPFKLNVAVMSTDNKIVTTYAQGSAKQVTVTLVDNSDGACVLDSTKPNYCSATCTAKTAVTGGNQILTFASLATDKGQKQTAPFTLNSAYQNLVAIISDSTTTACSTDSFSVRPTALALATTAIATTSGGTPVFKAGSDTFSLNATGANYSLAASSVPQTLTAVAGYTGTPTIGSIDTTPMGAGTWTTGNLSVGTTLAAAVAGTGVSSNSPTYSEVGLFKLAGFWPNTAGYASGNDTSARGVVDAAWTLVDSVSTKGDCVVGNYSNIKNLSGKYGCNFGLVTDTNFGRFTPDHFGIAGSLVTRSDVQPTEAQAVPFTYMDEPMKLVLAVTAYNKSEAPMQNYKASFAKLDATTLSTGSNWFSAGCTASTQCMGLAAVFGATSLTSRLAIDTTSTNSAAPSNATTAGGATAGWSGGTSYFTLYSKFSRLATPDGPYGDGTTSFLKIAAKPLDSDGVTLPPRSSTDTTHCSDLDITTGTQNIACNPGPTEVNLRRKLAQTTLRFGRLRLLNAYGSQLLPLRVDARAEYWDGSRWVVNGIDSSTMIPAAGVSMSGGISSNTCFLTNPRPAAPTNASCLPGGSPAATLLAGTGSWFVFDEITPLVGFVDLTINLSTMPWLKGYWSGAATGYTENPVARIKFGSPKAPYIYLRERY